MSRLSAVCFALLLCNLPALLPAQADSALSDTAQSIKVYLVSVYVPTPDSVDFAYLPHFDQQILEFVVPPEDSLNNLGDISLGEEDLEGPDCFIPELKVIYYKTTYIFSFYCSAVRKYKNSAPYTASSVRVKNDIPFSYTTSDYLSSLRNRYVTYTPVQEEFASKFIRQEALEGMSEEDINDLEAALRADEDDLLPADDEQELISNDQFLQAPDDDGVKPSDVEEPAGIDEEEEEGEGGSPPAPVEGGN